MRLIQVGDREFLAGMAPSTPGGAWIIKVNNTLVTSFSEVYEAVATAKQQHHMRLVVLMAHSEIKDGLTHERIP